jgi:glutathione S-transferase
VYPVAFGKTTTIETEKLDALKEALMWVNQMTACGFVQGASMTIADVDFLATMSTLEACGFMDLSPYKNLKSWSARMKTMVPNYEENCGKGAEQFGAWFKASFKP